MRNRGRRGDERGAVLVETAILIPVIVMITFGLIEFSSVYQSQSVGAGAARSAARTASAEAMLTNYATDAAAAAATALKTIAPDEPIELWVYKANDKGYPGAAGNTSFSSCTTSCIKYNWLSNTKAFDTANPSGQRLARRVAEGMRRRELGLGRCLHQARSQVHHEALRGLDHADRPRCLPARAGADAALRVAGW